MNSQKQAPGNSIQEINWGNAFRAQVIRSNPKEALPDPHWLSTFMTSPTGVDAAIDMRATDDKSAKNIASWSSYLPTDCVVVMVSLGWDRTT
jgi:hypothetical protein